MGDGARVFRYIFHESFHLISFPLQKGLSDWILTLRRKVFFSPEAALYPHVYA